MASTQQSTSRQKTGWGILITLLFCAGIALLPIFFSHINISTEQGLIVSRLAIWLFLTVIWLYALKVEKQPLSLWKERPYSAFHYFLSVLAISGILLLGQIIIAMIVKAIDPTLNDKSQRTVQMVLVFKKNFFLLFFVAFTAGITEELIFRSYLLTRLQFLFKTDYLPIIVSSLLFGFMHFSYGTIMQVIGPIFIGTVFSIYYYKFRNIKVLIICHFLWDFLALIMKVHAK